MAKKFDAALKELIDGYDAEWGRYLAARVGVVAPDPAILESDVSSVTLQADKVFRLGGDAACCTPSCNRAGKVTCRTSCCGTMWPWTTATARR